MFVNKVYKLPAKLIYNLKKKHITLNKTMHKCFNKVGQRHKKDNKEQENLYSRWKQLRNKEDPQSKAERDMLEDELAEEFFDKVKEAK